MATQALFVGFYMVSGHVRAGDVSGGVRAAAWTPAAAGPVTPDPVVLDNVYWELANERADERRRQRHDRLRARQAVATSPRLGGSAIYGTRISPVPFRPASPEWVVGTC
jgi:hypothetical protein